MIVSRCESVPMTDMNSTNGTLVNDEEVDQALLADGDRISFGDVVLTFRQSRD